MAFVFDIDDTLYDLMEPFRIAHEKLFADRVGSDCERIFIQSRRYSDVILEQERLGLIPRKETLFQRIKMSYQDVGIEVTREEGREFEKIYRYQQSRIHMFPFMEEVLDVCKAEKIPVAVLTNGNREGQWGKASTLKLERWFPSDRIFVTGEIGYHKPDVRAFREVERRLHMASADICYIGDSYESDMAGAGNAGWHTIWLNHRKQPCPDAISLAEHELHDGKELLPLLKRLVLV